jgi:hypothetical protein
VFPARGLLLSGKGTLTFRQGDSYFSARGLLLVGKGTLTCGQGDSYLWARGLLLVGKGDSYLSARGLLLVGKGTLTCRQGDSYLWARGLLLVGKGDSYFSARGRSLDARSFHLDGRQRAYTRNERNRDTHGDPRFHPSILCESRRSTAFLIKGGSGFGEPGEMAAQSRSCTGGRF